MLGVCRSEEGLKASPDYAKTVLQVFVDALEWYNSSRRLVHSDNTLDSGFTFAFAACMGLEWDYDDLLLCDILDLASDRLALALKKMINGSGDGG